MALFYKSTIVSIVLFSITSWGGNARQRDTDMIDRVIRKAEKITRTNFECFSSMYTAACTKKDT